MLWQEHSLLIFLDKRLLAIWEEHRLVFLRHGDGWRAWRRLMLALVFPEDHGHVGECWKEEVEDGKLEGGEEAEELSFDERVSRLMEASCLGGQQRADGT
jgi:hypothetical protein